MDGQLHGARAARRRSHRRLPGPPPRPRRDRQRRPRDRASTPSSPRAPGRAERVPPRHRVGRAARRGHNIEGRVQRLSQQISPEGTVMSDWRIAAELAAALRRRFRPRDGARGAGRDRPGRACLRRCRRRSVPARPGRRRPAARRPPRRARPRAAGPPLTDASREPILPGTISSEEALTSHVGTGVVESTGTGSTTTVKPGQTEVEGPAGRAPRPMRSAAGADEVAAGPPLHQWDRATGRAPAQAATHTRSGSSSGRKLYDAGRAVAASPSLAPLAAAATLLVHPSDRDRIGIRRRRRGAGHQRPAAPWAARARRPRGIPRGIVFLTFNQPWPRARATSSTPPPP